MARAGEALEEVRGLLEARHSCRAFLPEPLPAGTVERVLDVARLAPSWCNAQPWTVHLAEGEQAFALARRLHGLAESGAATGTDLPFPESYQGAYRDRRRETAAALYGAVGVAREDIASRTRQINENQRFYGAPHVLVVSTPRALGAYGVLDCGAFIALTLLAAEAMGVAALAEAAPALYSGELHRVLGIPDDRDIVAVVALGREDASHPANSFRVGRAPLAATVVRPDLRLAE